MAEENASRQKRGSSRQYLRGTSKMPRKMRRELEELICQNKIELSTAKRVRQDINLFDWLDNCSLEDVEDFPRENCWYVLGKIFYY